MTTVGYFQIAAASWVALLALRGFSLLQIGMLESIFHIVSLCFELPSGVVADVFGRRKTLIASQVAALISGTLMIFSTGFATTALALGCSALPFLCLFLLFFLFTQYFHIQPLLPGSFLYPEV